MNIESERKFLVRDDSFKLSATAALRIKQGYIAHESGRSVRVRTCNDKAYLTIKGPCFDSFSRMEWEKEIGLAEAGELFSLCKDGIIEKTRYIVPCLSDGGLARKWEIDEFYGDNDGLLVAEIEVAREDEEFNRPDWLGREVTGDKRYYNAWLCSHPFKDW